MKVFLTGGTGFIGSHVVMRFLDQGHEVVVLAREPGKIPGFADLKGLSLLQGQMDNLEVIGSALEGVDVFVHVALNYREERREMALWDDTAQTVALAGLASRCGVPHFIYTSSTSVHDELYSGAGRDPEARVLVDPYLACCPASFYGATKAACEQYLHALSFQTGMRVNVVRPGYAFGNPVVGGAPVQADRRFAVIAESALKGEALDYDCNDGTQFVWAGDLARLYIALAESDCNRKVYYGLSEMFVSWAELARLTIAKLGSGSELRVRGTPRDGGLFWDVSAMERDFGLKFDPWPHLETHVDYWVERVRGELGF